MVRSLRIGAVIAVLACTAPSWGQVLPQERYIMVQEDGKNAVKCKILKTKKEKDGTIVSEVQAVGGGPVMTIVEGGSPTATTTTTATPAKQGGLLARMFGGTAEKSTVVPTNTTTTSATTVPQFVKGDVVPATGTDLRQSWGSVNHTPVSGRAALPVAKPQSDPLDNPEAFSGVKVPTVTTEPTLSTGTANSLPSNPMAATPSVTTTVVSSTVGGECTSCQANGTCTSCQKEQTSKLFGRPLLARDSSVQKTGLLTRSAPATKGETGKGETTVVASDGTRLVLQGDTVVSATPPTAAGTSSDRQGLLSKRDVVKESKPTVVRERVVRDTATAGATTVIQPLRNEGRIGAFSGMQSQSASLSREERAARRASSMPRGMASAGAAMLPAVNSETQMGALARNADGSMGLVPASQVDPRKGMVAVAASNAFTMTQSSIPYVAMSPDQASNAFSMGTPSRPVPADMGSYPQIPNGFQAYGMGGAEYRPQLVMTNQGYYPAPAMGYANYPTQPMVHPGARMQAGTAVASDVHEPATGQALASLRGSVMPSDRERAALSLATANWKSDPHVLPALVVAAQGDPAPMVRITCLRVLVKMKAQTEPVVEAVKAMREDSDARVRQEAVTVLPLLMKP